MKCPVCKTELVQWKQLRLETLNEHVSNPNGTPSLKTAYHCPVDSCKVNGLDSDGIQGPIVFWNEDGELYVSHNFSYKATKDIPYIDNNNAPFGTFERKMNVEIRKKDDNKLLYTFNGILWKGWKVYSKYSYKSNEDGDILSCKLGFEWISPDGCIKSGPPPFDGISMLRYCLKNTFRQWLVCRKNPNNTWYSGELQASVRERSFHNPEWWRKVNAWFARKALNNLKIPIKESVY